jgi:nucleoside-diphosphate-sugar epimerase
MAKTAFVTGGTGFIGINLIQLLVSEGWDVTALHRPTSNIMIDAAASKGVETFIHTSSISAWGRVKGVVTEDTPQAGKDSWINYERSKHLGELDYRFQPMRVAVQDNYDWLVKEGLLAKSG